MVIYGTGGTVRVGPRIAGTIGAWRLERRSSEPTFHATLTLAHTDSWWITQRPLAAWLEIGTRTWVWTPGTVTGPDDAGVLRLEVEGAPAIH